MDVEFQPGKVIAPVTIRLFPEGIGDMELEFNVTLIVPPAAMSQGVVLGEPSVATITIHEISKYILKNYGR